VNDPRAFFFRIFFEFFHGNTEASRYLIEAFEPQVLSVSFFYSAKTVIGQSFIAENVRKFPVKLL
jgi:hypothetical protein